MRRDLPPLSLRQSVANAAAKKRKQMAREFITAIPIYCIVPQTHASVIIARLIRLDHKIDIQIYGN